MIDVRKLNGQKGFHSSYILLDGSQSIVIDPANSFHTIRQNLKKKELLGVFLTEASLSAAARCAELATHFGAQVYAPSIFLTSLQVLPQKAEKKGLCGVKIPQICFIKEGFEQKCGNNFSVKVHVLEKSCIYEVEGVGLFGGLLSPEVLKKSLGALFRKDSCIYTGYQA